MDIEWNTSSYGVGSVVVYFFFPSRRRHTRSYGDWSSDVCSSDLSVRRHAPRRRVWLLDQFVLFEFGHHVAYGGRAPARAAREALRDCARAYGLARSQVLFDDCGENGLAARVGRPVGLSL